MAKKRRTVITGIGMVTALGTSPGGFWEELMKGRSGITDLNRELLSGCASQKYGLIPPELLENLREKYLSDEEKTFSRCSQLALISSVMAVEDAGAVFEQKCDRARTGVSFGTTQGELYAFTEDRERTRSRFPAMIDIARHFGVCGEHFSCVNACSSGNYAIMQAMDAIEDGTADTVIACGADVYSDIVCAAFNRIKAVSKDSVKPFDVKRSGTVLAEGSAAIIVEELEHALARGANVYGELMGYGLSNDAYNMLAPDPSAEGIMTAMDMAVRRSGLVPDDIQHIMLHGTGTVANDNAEGRAVREYFGKHAGEITGTAIKGALGHQLGAASAISMAAAALIFKNGTIPPTINNNECMDIDFDLVLEVKSADKINIIMNNAYAFGGSNTSVILKRWTGK